MKIKENQILQGFIDSDQKHLLNFYYKGQLPRTKVRGL